MHAADIPVTLGDIRRIRRARLDRDLDRILEVVLGDAPDLRRHRGREQGDLSFGRCLGQNRLDVVDETHAQHFICFVEDQRGQSRQVQRAAIQMIDDTSWRANHDMGTTLESTQLRPVALPAVNRQHAKVRQMRGIALEGFGDLDSQLTRRCQHQCLRTGLAHVEAAQNRQRKRRRLASASLGLAEHVLALQ